MGNARWGGRERHRKKRLLPRASLLEAVALAVETFIAISGRVMPAIREKGARSFSAITEGCATKGTIYLPYSFFLSAFDLRAFRRGVLLFFLSVQLTALACVQ
jgi:hypothetical protein